jgi:signal transduction histidine kinase
LGQLLATAIGGPILLGGLTLGGHWMTPWFIPSIDLLAVGCMLTALALAGTDVILREDRRSLPTVGVAACTIVLWTAHALLSPGTVALVPQPFGNQAAGTEFLIISLATPILLAVGLLQPTRALPARRGALPRTAGLGLTLGTLFVGLGLLLTVYFPDGGDKFFGRAPVLGAVGLIPALVGLAVFARGWQGDQRVSGGVAAALVFAGLNAVTIGFSGPELAPIWYAGHILAFLTFAALLAGQVSLYTTSVRSEHVALARLEQAAQRLRRGLEVAEAMATETDLRTVIAHLLSGAVASVGADGGTVLRIEPRGAVVEAMIDGADIHAHVHRHFALEDFVSDGRPVVLDAVRHRMVGITGPCTARDGEELFGAAALATGTLTVPLTLGGEVDAVLLLFRRGGPPFGADDVEVIQGFGSIATLLVRNARLLEEAEAASRSKTTFLNMAAHELRTPLTVVMGYLDMLATGNLGPMTRIQKEAVSTSRAKALELSDQVERLLVASRLEGGSAVPHPPTVLLDLAAAVGEAVQRATARAHLAGGEVVAAVPNEPIWVQAEPRELGVILDNLINNALTYSRPPAEVRVEVKQDEGAVVRIIDRGIGVPEEHHTGIFEQFHRVEDPDFGYPAGTGLGLYISRRLAELQGGSLELESSSPGQGSTFALRLREAEVSLAALGDPRRSGGV